MGKGYSGRFMRIYQTLRYGHRQMNVACIANSRQEQKQEKKAQYRYDVVTEDYSAC